MVDPPADPPPQLTSRVNADQLAQLDIISYLAVVETLFDAEAIIIPGYDGPQAYLIPRAWLSRH